MRVVSLGPVWSKKDWLTMAVEWLRAARRSLLLVVSRGRLFWLRIWLCRQSTAARMAGALVVVGVSSVLAQGVAWALAGISRAAEASAAVRLSRGRRGRTSDLQGRDR